MPGAGIANVRGIEEGKAEVGFGNSISTVDGSPATRRSPSSTRMSATSRRCTRNISRSSSRANAGINSIKDLKGKAVATQPRGNTAEIITQHILKVNGLSYNDVKPSFISYTDAVEQMKDGNVQAFTLGTTIPSGAVMDLASARDIKLLDLSDLLEAMKKINPGYTLVTVPKGTYPKQDQDVKVIGYATHIVASCELPEDTRLHHDEGDGRQRLHDGRDQQGDGGAHPAGDGRGHRRAVPSRRGEVLQGEGHRREDDVRRTNRLTDEGQFSPAPYPEARAPGPPSAGPRTGSGEPRRTQPRRRGAPPPVRASRLGASLFAPQREEVWR